MKHFDTQPNLNAKVIFIELICNDPQIIETNIQRKSASPDYCTMKREEVRLSPSLV